MKYVQGFTLILVLLSARPQACFSQQGMPAFKLALAQMRVVGGALETNLEHAADVILSPSAWAVPADHNNSEDPYGEWWRKAYKPVARDFRVWIAGCSNVGWMTGGPWMGSKVIGCSMVFAPGGEEALLGPFGEDADTILYLDIKPEPRPGQGTTWHNYWDSLDSAPEY